MSRTSVTEALILRASRFGDYHKQLVVLTPEQGILRALAYGAFKGKSRLVSTSDPYSHVRLHLYHNPVRDQYKITDIEVVRCFEGLRNDLSRSFAASLAAEVTVSSYAGGGPDYRFPYGLLRRTFGIMDTADGELVLRAVFQYLLRFLMHAGFLNAAEEECGRCGRVFEAAEEVYYSSSDGELSCFGCALDGAFGVSPGVRRYMKSALEFPLSRALEIRPDAALRRGLIRLLRELLNDALQSPVRSFDTYFGTVAL